MDEMDAMLAEIQKTHPPLTRAQGLARRKVEAEIDEKYPGQYVGFVDTWSGDTLDRQVVAAAADWDGYQAQLGRLAPEVRERVQFTHPPGPDEELSIGGADFWAS